jgi:hypothetical protein
MSSDDVGNLWMVWWCIKLMYLFDYTGMHSVHWLDRYLSHFRILD